MFTQALSTRPIFSVITPVYNAAQYVERSYACLKAQTLTNWEWIVVDDASNDRTRALIESFEDSRIKLLFYSRHRGRGYARTRALENASGKWMVVWDIDDVYFPDRLAIIEQARVADYEFFCSYAVLVDEGLNITGRRGFIAPDFGLPRRFAHPTLACELGLARSIGYPASMATGEDILLMLSLAAKHRGWFHHDSLMAYKQDSRDSPVKAMYGHFNFVRALYLARSRRLVSIGRFLMLRHGLRSAARVVTLAAMTAIPFTYRYTIRQRNSGEVSPNWRLSPDREAFVAAARGGAIAQGWAKPSLSNSHSVSYPPPVT